MSASEVGNIFIIDILFQVAACVGAWSKPLQDLNHLLTIIYMRNSN